MPWLRLTQANKACLESLFAFLQLFHSGNADFKSSQVVLMASRIVSRDIDTADQRSYVSARVGMGIDINDVEAAGVLLKFGEARWAIEAALSTR